MNISFHRFEEGISEEETMEQLPKFGHKFGVDSTVIGDVQSIWIDQKEGIYKGVADLCRNEAAIGIDF